MTRTFNKESYASLLAQYQPKAIATEEENEATIALAGELEHYPLLEGNPHSMLLHLMEVRGLKQEDLVGVIGSRGVVSEVVNGKRSISKVQAKVLGEFFHVSPQIFI